MNAIERKTLKAVLSAEQLQKDVNSMAEERDALAVK